MKTRRKDPQIEEADETLPETQTEEALGDNVAEGSQSASLGRKTIPEPDDARIPIRAAVELIRADRADNKTDTLNTYVRSLASTRPSQESTLWLKEFRPNTLVQTVNDTGQQIKAINTLADFPELRRRFRFQFEKQFEAGKKGKKRVKNKKATPDMEAVLRKNVKLPLHAARYFMFDIPIYENWKHLFEQAKHRNALADIGEYLAEKNIKLSTLRSDPKTFAKTMLAMLKESDLANGDVHLHVILRLQENQEWFRHRLNGDFDEKLAPTLDSNKSLLNYTIQLGKVLLYLRAQDDIKEEDFRAKALEKRGEIEAYWENDLSIIYLHIEKTFIDVEINQSVSMDVDAADQSTQPDLDYKEGEELSDEVRIPLRTPIAEKIDGAPPFNSIEEMMNVIAPNKEKRDQMTKASMVSDMNAYVHPLVAPMTLNEAISDIPTLARFRDYLLWRMKLSVSYSKEKVARKQKRVNTFFNRLRRYCFGDRTPDVLKAAFPTLKHQTVVYDFIEHLAINGMRFSDVENNPKKCAEEIWEALRYKRYANDDAHKFVFARIPALLMPLEKRHLWEDQVDALKRWQPANSTTNETIYHNVMIQLFKEFGFKYDQYKPALMERGEEFAAASGMNQINARAVIGMMKKFPDVFLNEKGEYEAVATETLQEIWSLMPMEDVIEPSSSIGNEKKSLDDEELDVYDDKENEEEIEAEIEEEIDVDEELHSDNDELEVTEDLLMKDAQTQLLEAPFSESGNSPIPMDMEEHGSGHTTEYDEYIFIRELTTRTIVYPVKMTTEEIDGKTHYRKDVLLDEGTVFEHEQIYDPKPNFIFLDPDNPCFVDPEFRDENDFTKCSSNVKILDVKFTELPEELKKKEAERIAEERGQSKGAPGKVAFLDSRENFDLLLRRMSNSKLNPNEIDNCRNEKEAELKAYLTALARTEHHPVHDKLKIEVLQASKLPLKEKGLANEYGAIVTKNVRYNGKYPVEVFGFFSGEHHPESEVEKYHPDKNDPGKSFALNVLQPDGRITTIWPYGSGDRHQYVNTSVKIDKKSGKYVADESRCNGVFLGVTVTLTNNKGKPCTRYTSAPVGFGQMWPNREFRVNYGDFIRDFAEKIEQAEARKAAEAKRVRSPLERHLIAHLKQKSGAETGGVSSEAQSDPPKFIEWNKQDLMEIRRQIKETTGSDSCKIELVSDEESVNVRGAPFRRASNDSIFFQAGNVTDWMNSKTVKVAEKSQIERFDSLKYKQIVAQLSPGAKKKTSPNWVGMNIPPKSIDTPSTSQGLARRKDR